MIEKLVNEINFDDFKDEFCLLLEKELEINKKKLQKKDLTFDEYVFDTYLVKPSFLLRHLINKK